MSRLPGAAWVPLPLFSTQQMSAHNIVCIHTMVGSLMGTDGYFRGLTNGTNAHYGTGGAGEQIRQWGDTKYRSGANYNGNGDCITIENADMGPGFPSWDTSNSAAVPAFTELQLDDLADILAWETSLEAHAACSSTWECHKVGIPLDIIPDSKPGRRGIGYHKLGVPGYVVDGGVLWSTKQGKVCPADRRVAQIPEIIRRAKLKRSGSVAAASPVQNIISLNQEETMELPYLQTTHLTVPAIPSGFKAVLTVTGQSDIGAVIYSKGIGSGGGVARLLGTSADWKLWVAPGFKATADVTGYAAVELINYGAQDPADKTKSITALAGAVITLVPAP